MYSWVCASIPGFILNKTVLVAYIFRQWWQLSQVQLHYQPQFERYF